MNSERLNEVIDTLERSRTTDSGVFRRACEGVAPLHDSADGKHTIRVVLTVSHSKEHKVYSVRAHIDALDKNPPDGFVCSKWEPMNRRHNWAIVSVPVARFSVKTMQETYQKTIAALRSDPAMLAENLDLQFREVFQ